MATHDYVIDNQSAPAFRSDLNNALLAIVSQNSASTAPTTTYANMLWYDTATNILKKRNEANSAWINLGTVDEGTGTFTPSGERALASQAQAEAGTDNTTVMTPLRAAQAIAALAGSIDYQAFTASGTWTKPAGISADAMVHFLVIGGGASGAAYWRGNNGNVRYAGGGSGGGGYFGSVLASSLGSTVAVTVGAGGAAQTVTVSGSSSGTVSVAGGGTSSFGSYSVAGGSVSVSTNTFTTPHGFDGHVGGDATTEISFVLDQNAIYGGGAGGSNSTGAVLNGPGASMFGGAGGAAAYGASSVGAAGSAPGGGGGAASNNTTTSSGTVTSGAGARGEVRVWTIG